MLSPEMLRALQNQYTLERTNAAYYDMLAVSAEFAYWPGVVEWMKAAANDERSHAQKISDYVIDRNAGPLMLEALEYVPTIDGADMVTLFQAAMTRETMTTARINALYQQADEINDPQTCVFLHWFIDEQTKSEGEINNYLVLLRRLDSNGKIVFDHEMMKP